MKPLKVRKKEFLLALRRTRDVGKACAACAVGRRTVYDWKHKDQGFADDWAVALSPPDPVVALAATVEAIAHDPLADPRERIRAAKVAARLIDPMALGDDKKPYHITQAERAARRNRQPPSERTLETIGVAAIGATAGLCIFAFISDPGGEFRATREIYEGFSGLSPDGRRAVIATVGREAPKELRRELVARLRDLHRAAG